MKSWLILLLLVYSTNQKRRRCPQGLKMNLRGRCIKGWGATVGSTPRVRALERLAQHLKSELGRDVLIPCRNMDLLEHCEVCFKNDPGKTFCPRTEYDQNDFKRFLFTSVGDDMTEWLCMTGNPTKDDLPDGFSYWSGYDDGSICDCGTPFVAEWEDTPLQHPPLPLSVSFRPLKNTEERPGFNEGSSIVDEHTGGPKWLSHGGEHHNDDWEAATPGYERDSRGIWNSRPPNESPSACSRKPDISSIFELRFKQDEEYKWDLVPKNSNDCILEDTYLAWYNGEPIDSESRQDEAGDHRWCKAKCDANPQCGGWTLSRSNGWCALKRTNQIKKQGKKKWVSGIKNC